jgi:isocitrate dehydrogenase kinase/phosphatase
MNEPASLKRTTAAIGNAGLQELLTERDRGERARIVAEIIVAVFNDYYARSRRMPHLAKEAFEARQWPVVLDLSKERLSIYSQSVQRLGPVIRAGCPELTSDEGFWSEVESRYLEMIRGRYEADLAFAFLNSMRRQVYADEWKPVEYSHGRAAAPSSSLSEPVVRMFQSVMPVAAESVRKILSIPKFNTPWRSLEGDAALVAEAISAAVARTGQGDGSALKIFMINAGFYRNRGAYLLGRIAVPGFGMLPLLIALLNDKDGIFVDAVLTESDELQYVFSSTLANFHVTNPHYHELAQFMFSVMPKRPLGLHYSTIGFNHVGKVAVINEIAREQARTGERLDTAVGFRGTVAIGFSMPSSRYVMKIIRDTPTAGYKWGSFAGVGAVIEKYRLVHDINRAGSMLDNIIYYNIRLNRSWFAPDLLDELVAEAPSTVSVQGDGVVFKHIITQMKLVPLPVFLETASRADAEAAVINLGICIKNNAAANIFNKDLDGRNYGVSRILKVYLFDYDAVEPLTDVKVRTNTGRIDGEEDIPDWFFESGTIFLPEEMMVGLRIDDRELRRLFAVSHPELMTVEYWEGMQRALLEGKVPKVRAYPESRRLTRKPV